MAASPAQEFLDRLHGALRVAHVLARSVRIASLERRHRFLQLVVHPGLRFADIAPQSQALTRLLLLEGLQARARRARADRQFVEALAQFGKFGIDGRSHGRRLSRGLGGRRLRQ